MGSGHFLVETVDFITDRMLDFFNCFPWNSIQTELKKTRETILEEMDRQGVIIDPGRLTDVALMKRHVLKRCIYGVDLNPLEEEKRAIESAPKIVDPAQQLVGTVLQEYLHHPELDRKELVSLMGFLSQPLPRIYGKRLREQYKAFSDTKDINRLVEEVRKLRDESGKEETKFSQRTSRPLKKEDLHLICFDYLSA
jgi:hypothetical protein